MRSAVIVVLVIGAAFCAFYFLKPRQVSLKEATSRTQELVTRAGGPGEICSEAQQLFTEFGTSRLTILNTNDLRHHPRIAALGHVSGIWPGEPPYLKILVGNHISGFQIDVTDRSRQQAAGPAGAEWIEDCIYVQR